MQRVECGTISRVVRRRGARDGNAAMGRATTVWHVPAAEDYQSQLEESRAGFARREGAASQGSSLVSYWILSSWTWTVWRLHAQGAAWEANGRTAPILRTTSAHTYIPAGMYGYAVAFVSLVGSPTIPMFPAIRSALERPLRRPSHPGRSLVTNPVTVPTSSPWRPSIVGETSLGRWLCIP